MSLSKCGTAARKHIPWAWYERRYPSSAAFRTWSSVSFVMAFRLLTVRASPPIRRQSPDAKPFSAPRQSRHGTRRLSSRHPLRPESRNAHSSLVAGNATSPCVYPDRYSSRIGILRELRRLCCRLTSPSEHELDVVRAAEHRSIALALAFARFRFRLQAGPLFLLLRRRSGDDSFRFRSGLSGGTRSRPCTAGLFLVLR